MAQTLVPVADTPNDIGFGLNENWVPDPIFTVLDEGASPSDADFGELTTYDNISADTPGFVVQLTSATDPADDTNHVINFRFNYDVGAGTANFIFFSLYQGDPTGTGVYITDTLFGAGSGTSTTLSGLTGSAPFTTYSYTLANAEAAAITDYTDLWIQANFSASDQSFNMVANPTNQLQVSWLEMEIPGGDICTWWKINGPGGDDGPFGNWFKEACSPAGDVPPDDISFNFDFFWDGIFYPAGTIFTWTSTTAPDNTGWWSSDVDFQGAATLLDNARPKDLRSFAEIAAFANGSAGIFGGFPGPACQFGNRMVYAPGGYSVGTDLPTIRNFDGVSDREVASLPKTSTGGIPKGIMTMLSANGTVYLTTLDSGTSASDFAGRVFELDMESGNLTQIGSAFSSGQLPYCLAWHNGRLWMGTNSGAPGTTVGKIYYMRQDGVDTDWTIENTLTAACAVCMLSYRGLLYIGCSASAGNSAKVLVRGVDNAYTTSRTGAGTAANNAFLAMTLFGDSLYTSYWNPSTLSEIHQLSFLPGDSDPEVATWTIVYDQMDDGITKPWVAFPVDEDVMLALAGGLTYTAALILTEDGAVWEDRTVFLTQSTTSSTGLPGWAIVVR